MKLHQSQYFMDSTQRVAAGLRPGEPVDLSDAETKAEARHAISVRKRIKRQLPVYRNAAVSGVAIGLLAQLAGSALGGILIATGGVLVGYLSFTAGAFTTVHGPSSTNLKVRQGKRTSRGNP